LKFKFCRFGGGEGRGCTFTSSPAKLYFVHMVGKLVSN